MLPHLPVLVAALQALAGPDLASIEREVYVMGTRASVHVEARRRVDAVGATEAIVAALEDHDDLLSTWRDDTPLSRFNQGASISPGPRLVLLLSEAERWAVRTGRAFDPTVGALVDLWGLRGTGGSPSDAEVAEALTHVGPAALRVTPEGVERASSRAWIDPGGFGKGAALRAVLEDLDRGGLSSVRVDLGGQLLVWSDDHRGGAVTVAHPERRRCPVTRLRVANASVATTGASERGAGSGEARVGHVLDPRSGRPVPAWGSVTVVHEDPLAADVLSTALFVMGPDEGPDWARAHGVSALFLVADGEGLRTLRTGQLEGGPVATRGPCTRSESSGIQGVLK